MYIMIMKSRKVVTLSLNELTELIKIDGGIVDTYSRYMNNMTLLSRLDADRDVAQDFVDDTISNDLVIRRVETETDDQVYRLNSALSRMGSNKRFQYNELEA